MAITAAPELCRLPPVSPNLLYVGHGSRNRFSSPSPHTPGLSLPPPSATGAGAQADVQPHGEERGWSNDQSCPQQPATHTDREGCTEQSDKPDPGTQSFAFGSSEPNDAEEGGL